MGRAPELARIQALLATARQGDSGALVIRGDPGIGKTMLLRAAIESAEEMRVLHARGIESEADIPFGALVDLLRPAENVLDTVPAHLATALRGALGLGPAGALTPLQIGVALLSVLAVAAEERPLLVVVDDLHWVDEASAGALLFAARRLGGEGVAMLLAVRDRESRLYDTGGIDELALGPLDRAAARELVGHVSAAVSEEVFGRLFERTGGNPLALIETVRLLGPEERSGRMPLPMLVRSGHRIEAAFSRRIAELSAAGRRALLVAAAADNSDANELDAALGGLGLSLEALSEPEARGLVALDDGRVEFLHPLLRSVAYHAAGAAERRAAHAALARALADSSPARSVLHRAAAAITPDEETAGALERVAHDAASKGGPLEAARTLERAAALSPDRGARAQRLLAASQLAALGGDFSYAEALADRGQPGADDASLRAGFVLQRGLVKMSVGSPRAASDELVAGAARVERSDPEMAALMLATGAWVCMMQGEARAPLALADRAAKLVSGEPGFTRLAVLASRSIARIAAGRGREEGPTLLHIASSLDGNEPASHPVFMLIGQQLAWVERFDDAMRILRHRVAVARDQGLPMMLPYELASMAEVELWFGELGAAYADAAEAVQLARDTHARNFLAFGLATLARVEAMRGLAEDCRDHAAEAVGLAQCLGTGSIFHYIGGAIGLLELGSGRPLAAIRALEPIAERAMRDGVEHPTLVPWQPDLVEAYIRFDRRADAERELEVLERRARMTGGTWSAAAALRCRGLLAGVNSFDDWFRRALWLHASQPLVLERARTELCFGERLRRAGRRREAREPLRRALDAFDRAGARPWAELAHAELVAAGERPEQRLASDEGDLTAQELQVARVVAAGASNAEAAAQLFISPKTVEKHLTSAYRKLAVHSRAQLAARYARRDPTAPRASRK